MGLLRRGAGKAASNAVRRSIVEFVPEPAYQAQLVADEAAMRLQGAGGHIYVGDRGDPVWTFAGDAGRNVQRFVSAVPVVATRGARGTYHDAAPTIETGAVGDNPYADPAARIFAARMTRRA